MKSWNKTYTTLIECRRTTPFSTKERDKTKTVTRTGWQTDRQWSRRVLAREMTLINEKYFMKSKFTPNSFTNFLYLWQRTLIKERGGMVKIANKTNHLTGVLWNGTWHLFLCLRDICYVFVESFKSNQSHNDKVKLTFIRFLSIMESIILSSKFYSAQNKK